jgi:ribosomal protein L27
MYYMVKDLGRVMGLENFYRQRGRQMFASRLFGHGMDALLECS